MKKVAKLVMIDHEDKYLLMYRSDHPTFGADPDLPGGTLEDGESTLETMIREVEEEAGVIVTPGDAEEIYAGSEYSRHATYNALYCVKFAKRPPIIMSWEHSRYEWIPREEFIEKSRGAVDTYMHMVADVIERQTKESDYESKLPDDK